MPYPNEQIPQDLEGQMLFALAVISGREQIQLMDLRDNTFLSDLRKGFERRQVDGFERVIDTKPNSLDMREHFKRVRLNFSEPDPWYHGAHDDKIRDLLTLRQGILNTNPGFLGKLGLLWRHQETPQGLWALGKYYFLSWFLLLSLLEHKVYGLAYDWRIIPGYLICYGACQPDGSNLIFARYDVCQSSCAITLLGEAGYEAIRNHNEFVLLTSIALGVCIFLGIAIIIYYSFAQFCYGDQFQSTFLGFSEIAAFWRLIREIAVTPYHQLNVNKLGEGHQVCFERLTGFCQQLGIEPAAMQLFKTLSATDRLNIIILALILHQDKACRAVVSVDSGLTLDPKDSYSVFFRMLLQLYTRSTDSLSVGLPVGASSIHGEPGEATRLLTIGGASHASNTQTSSMFRHYRMAPEHINRIIASYPEELIVNSSVASSSNNDDSTDYITLDF